MRLRAEIGTIPSGRCFMARRFHPLREGETNIILANALNYLFRTGELIRVSRGLYKRGSLL